MPWAHLACYPGRMRRVGSIGLLGLLYACSCRPVPAATPHAEPLAARPTQEAAAGPTAEPEPEPEPTATATPAVADELLAELPPHVIPPEGWPAELPWVSDAELTYPQAETSPAGDVRARWSAPRARLGDVSIRLFRRLAAAGYTATVPCTLGEGSSCALRREDRRATLSAGVSYPGGEHVNLTLHLLPANHHPIAKLPGKCVPPPVHARAVLVSAAGFDQEGNYRQAETRYAVETFFGPDLDGDGAPEVYVPHPSKGRCPWEVPHDVYVTRDGCGHRVGTIVGPITDETPIAPFVKGLRTITTEAVWAEHDGDFPEPNHHTRTRRYAFDGRRLALRADDDREGKCHHCGAVHCLPL